MHVYFQSTIRFFFILKIIYTFVLYPHCEIHGAKEASISFDKQAGGKDSNWITVKVPEDIKKGSRILEVSARASDPKYNKDIVYSFHTTLSEIDHDAFDIKTDLQSSPPKGYVIVKEPLSYIHWPQYELELVASIGDPESGPSDHLVVTVVVQDINDAPEITVRNITNFQEVDVLYIHQDTPSDTFVANISVSVKFLGVFFDKIWGCCDIYGSLPTSNYIFFLSLVVCVTHL